MGLPPAPLLLLAATVAGCTAKPETLQLTSTEWREDLHFFARELPRRHQNAFHHLSQERFLAEVAALDKKLETLDADATYVGLSRLSNLIGDAHTYLRVPQDDANLPFDFWRFGDAYRVTSAVVGQERSLGARVLEVEGVPIAMAIALAREQTPDDENPNYRDGLASMRLTTGIFLHGMGFTKDRETAHYTLSDDQGQFTLTVRVPPKGAPAAAEISLPKERPLFRQRPDEPFRVVWLANAKTVYCNFRSYQNLGANAQLLFDVIRRQHPDKLVVDLRGNSGGDYVEGLKHLVEPLRQDGELNRPGHLFVLIGPFTFSAAMANAAQFRQRTAALLVGQPIGEKPNSYQEPEAVTLPNSHLTLRYSTRYYAFAPGGDNVIRPDHELVPSWEDFAAGRDPVLDWVLAYRAP